MQEVCEVVEANFSDARSAGYDRQQWQRLKEEALARPLRDRAAAYRCAWRVSGMSERGRLAEFAGGYLAWYNAALCHPAAPCRACKGVPDAVHVPRSPACPHAPWQHDSGAAGCAAGPLHALHLTGGLPGNAQVRAHLR